jgi:hypothetical protein
MSSLASRHFFDGAEIDVIGAEFGIGFALIEFDRFDRVQADA